MSQTLLLFAVGGMIPFGCWTRKDHEEVEVFGEADWHSFWVRLRKAPWFPRCAGRPGLARRPTQLAQEVRRADSIGDEAAEATRGRGSSGWYVSRERAGSSPDQPAVSAASAQAGLSPAVRDVSAERGGWGCGCEPDMGVDMSASYENAYRILTSKENKSWTSITVALI
jgi:hypothetical protein